MRPFAIHTLHILLIIQILETISIKTRTTVGVNDSLTQA